ncbi:MAG: 3-dehydroquinate synthase [Lachnospiraceae bacterium]|nr:3-dehydroquinate synthase [Lachnospiraceae bacterium]
MENIKVLTENKEYPICFENSFDGLRDAVEKSGLKERKLCIIADTNVEPIYAQQVADELSGEFSQIDICTFEAGENSKNINTITDFYDFFMEKKLDRKSVIAGLGGGVCGDMAGFAAATYMRGVTFVQIPTSLLAQVDSSVGGKVGIDYKNGKNVVGAFYQPDFVYININTLNTLPVREFNAGMAEVIKYGPIASYEFYEFIKTNKAKIKALDEATMATVIGECCKIKADVVSKDEKEGGLREILNFGHTIGHAIETVKEFTLLHGECVAIGMVAVLKICVERGYITQEFLDEFIELLRYFDLPVYAEGISTEAVHRQMFFDKKVKNNKISFVLIKKMGETLRTDQVTEEEIKMAIEYVTKKEM